RAVDADLDRSGRGRRPAGAARGALLLLACHDDRAHGRGDDESASRSRGIAQSGHRDLLLSEGSQRRANEDRRTRRRWQCRCTNPAPGVPWQPRTRGASRSDCATAPERADRPRSECMTTRVLRDDDPIETQEWVDALKSVLHHEGPARAQQLLAKVAYEASRAGAPFHSVTTPYVNTIPPESQERPDGSPEIQNRIHALITSNAIAIILRANKESSELGGHIASFQSAATLYDVGFTHFWRAPSDGRAGDLVYIQGHSSPGIYARAFVEGRLTEAQLVGFRQETDGTGLSSYPHPWLMPEFWQFPTVSMGLGPLMAIYQARFLKYLAGRGLADTEGRKVW